ncbi:conserved hypothetical protein [Photorhabdus asymbiotica]|uniref:Uncharacterized protein n=1 Tax=Photorhabdus asymbiotica subsp. asymbiotica (strain ATCC 43949 / 3105-77) TaxID=553480 RepID=B6VKC0_PHOAA|nr:conserved hypothetical protein [Photorhabdus asymbiotica]CAR66600.1 Conserved Hypothetical Protein [Photorhabdus asymbiotica subsp. asymbiotica ATCC 43949]
MAVNIEALINILGKSYQEIFIEKQSFNYYLGGKMY